MSASPSTRLEISRYSQSTIPHVLLDDATNTILETNSAADQLFGRSLQDVSFPRLLHPLEEGRDITTQMVFQENMPAILSNRAQPLWTLRDEVKEKAWRGKITVLERAPQLKQSILAIPDALQDEIDSAGPLIPKRNIQVLVAEDSEASIKSLKKLFNDLKFSTEQVVFVEDGEDAVEEVRKSPKHFIILDNQMPKMYGVVAAPLIRAIEKERGQVPSAMILSSAFSTEAEKLPEFDAIIPKPLGSDAFRKFLLAHWPKETQLS